MEAYRIEKNPRDGDDDEEESGAGGETRKKKEKAWRPENEGEDTYHSLSHGASGEFFLSRQPGMLEKWLGEPKPEKEIDEDEEAGEEREEEKKETSKPAAEVAAGEAQEPAQESADEKTEHKHKNAGPPAPRPQQESLAAPHAEKPAWLEEDEAKFTKIMQEEFGQAPLKKATSDELLTDVEPGRPAAVEYATNERERTHTVESYRAEQEQRYEGVVPGRAAEVSPSQGEAGSFVPPAVTQPLAGSRPPTERTPDAVPRYIEHRRGLREGMAAALLMTVAVAGYLANKRRKQEIQELQKEHSKDIRQQEAAVHRLAVEQQAVRQQITGQEERFAALRAQHQRQIEQAKARAAADKSAASLQAAERFRQAPPTEGLSPVAMSTKPEAAKQTQKTDAEAAARRAVEAARALEEDEAKVQDEQIVTQDAWLRHVVDKSGHEIQGAVHHGHEYEAERAQEIQDNRPTDAIAVSPKDEREYQQAIKSTVFTGAAMGGPAQQQPHTSPMRTTTLDSDIADDGHSLPAGMPKPGDWQYQLPPGKKHGPIVSALTSPWLFLMLSLILLAYFIASLL